VAGDEAVVDSELVGKVASFGDADRIDLADEIGDCDIRCRQLLTVPTLVVDPFDFGVVAVGVNEVPATLADRGERIVVDLAAGDYRDFVVEEANELAN